MPDIESIQINLKVEEIKEDNKRCKVLYHPLIGNKVNMYSCTALTKKGSIKVVQVSDFPTRFDRVRPYENHMDEPIVISSAEEVNRQNSGVQYGSYAHKWAEEIKGDKNALPHL